MEVSGKLALQLEPRNALYVPGDQPFKDAWQHGKFGHDEYGELAWPPRSSAQHPKDFNICEIRLLRTKLSVVVLIPLFE